MKWPEDWGRFLMKQKWVARNIFWCKMITVSSQELVDLQRYLQTCMKETVPALMKRISIATQRVLFLLDCTILPKEDIQLNTRYCNKLWVIILLRNSTAEYSTGPKTWLQCLTWPKPGLATSGTRWRMPWGRGWTSSRPRWTRPARTLTCSWGRILQFWPWMKWGAALRSLTSK